MQLTDADFAYHLAKVGNGLRKTFIGATTKMGPGHRSFGQMSKLKSVGPFLSKAAITKARTP